MARTRKEEKQLQLLAERLIDARERAGFETLEDAAKVVKIPAHTIRSYERGRFVPSALKIAQLASGYDMSADYLLGLTAKRKKAPKG